MPNRDLTLDPTPQAAPPANGGEASSAPPTSETVDTPQGNTTDSADALAPKPTGAAEEVEAIRNHVRSVLNLKK